MSNPLCPKCKTETVLNTVLFKEFFYCRVCKEEVKDISPTWDDGNNNIYFFTLTVNSGGTFCRGGPKHISCDCVICREAYL